MLRKTLILLAVAAVAAGASTFAYASIPDASGLIHSCYHVNGQGQVDGSAQLRVIDPASQNKDGKACKKDENELDWNQQGIQGPQGPQGAQGAQGVQGQQGPQGPAGPASGHVYVSNPNSHVIDNPQPAEQEIVGLSGLPAGNYLIWSPIEIYGDDGDFDAQCAWRINDAPLEPNPTNGQFPLYDAKDDQHGQFPMFGEVNLPDASNSVVVFCSTTSGNKPQASGQMIAMQIGAVN